MMPVIPPEKMADLKMYRDLTGKSLRDAIYGFAAADCDLDKALIAFDKQVEHINASRLSRMKE